MKECFKCCLISMGIGFVVGAMVAANNKKVSNAMKEAKMMAMEKLDEAKESIETVKEKITEKIEDVKDSQQEKDMDKDLKKSNQSKTKGSK